MTHEIHEWNDPEGAIEAEYNDPNILISSPIEILRAGMVGKTLILQGTHKVIKDVWMQEGSRIAATLLLHDNSALRIYFPTLLKFYQPEEETEQEWVAVEAKKSKQVKQLEYGFFIVLVVVVVLLLLSLKLC